MGEAQRHPWAPQSTPRQAAPSGHAAPARMLLCRERRACAGSNAGGATSQRCGAPFSPPQDEVSVSAASCLAEQWQAAAAFHPSIRMRLFVGDEHLWPPQIPAPGSNAAAACHCSDAAAGCLLDAQYSIPQPCPRSCGQWAVDVQCPGTIDQCHLSLLHHPPPPPLPPLLPAPASAWLKRTGSPLRPCNANMHDAPR